MLLRPYCLSSEELGQDVFLCAVRKGLLLKWWAEGSTGCCWVCWLQLLDSHTAVAVLANAAEGPGECSFLPSPNDLQVPSRLPVWHKLSCWQCEHCSPVHLSLCCSGGGLFFWHRNMGREEMPRLWCWHGGEALLTSRLGAQCPLPLLMPFTWRLQYRHRADTSERLFFRTWGTGEDSAKMMKMPRPEVSEQLFPHTIVWEPFLFLQRQVGGRESQEKDRSR